MKKTAVVTGAAMGIGNAIALQLAEHGYMVYAADILKTDESISNIKYVSCDVSKETDVLALFETVKREQGHCDVLVNNAAIQYITPFEELSFDEWKRVIDVNLHGVFLCTKILLPLLKESRQGNIVNITSLHHNSARLDKYHYDASKAAVTIFTKEMALALAKYRIRVNAVAPGAMDTPMNEKVFSDPEVLQKAIEKIPLQRLGLAEDVANAVLFLISERASYITGDSIKVDGGRGV